MKVNMAKKSINELQDVTITHVSYVKRGANQKPFLLAKSEDIPKTPDLELNVKVAMSADEEKQLLYGIVYEPDEIDAHGDMMSAEEIEKTAHEFIEYYRNIDTEHNLMAGAGSVVESYIAPDDMTVNGSVVKKGSWILVTKATDEIWEEYKSGDVTGYSMYGIARKTISKEPEVGWLQKKLESLGIIKSFKDTLDERIDAQLSDPYFIMGIIEDDFWKNWNWEDTKVEELEKFKETLQGAITHINGVIASKNNIMKDEDKNMVTEDTAKVVKTDDTSVDNTATTENTENTQTENTTETTPTEPENTENANDEVAKSVQALIDRLAGMESVIKSVDEIKAENAEIKEKNAKLESELAELNKIVDKQMVSSGYTENVVKSNEDDNTSLPFLR